MQAQAKTAPTTTLNFGYWLQGKVAIPLPGFLPQAKWAHVEHRKKSTTAIKVRNVGETLKF